MHASLNLDLNALEASGNISVVSEIFPRWSEPERLGVIVHDLYGAVGASLLIQTFMATFYKTNPVAAGEQAQYPPAFMFHVGGRYGDFSSLDFWPARRQVILDNDSYEVLGAIRDRGITRLLVPNSPAHEIDYIWEAPSGWTDLHAAQQEIKSIYEYSPTGAVAEPDFTLTPFNEQFGRMVDETLDVETLIADFRKSTDEELDAMELGPSTAADFHGWLDYFISRAEEVPRDKRLALIKSKIAHTPQSFRSLTLQAGLRQLTK